MLTAELMHADLPNLQQSCTGPKTGPKQQGSCHTGWCCLYQKTEKRTSDYWRQLSTARVTFSKLRSYCVFVSGKLSLLCSVEREWVVAMRWMPSVVNWDSGMSACCNAGPTDHQCGQWMAPQCTAVTSAHANRLQLVRLYRDAGHKSDSFYF